MSDELSRQIDRVVEILLNSNRVVVFTGAGLSTESGIPDFRGKNGLWKKVDPKTSHIDYFLKYPDRYWSRAAGLDDGPTLGNILEKKPNNGHLSVAELGKLGKLSAIITQNVDGLHHKAAEQMNVDGVPIYELHGTMRTARCMDCGEKYSRMDIIVRVKNGELPPRHESCKDEYYGGLIKTNTVLFGEPLPMEAIDGAWSAAQNSDCVLALGSTLTVSPANHIPRIAKENGAKFIIINLDSTVMDYLADVVILGKLGKVLPEIMTKMKSAIQVE